MAGESGDPEDRTEAPTARRRQKAQEDGQMPVSREVVLLAGLAAMTLTFMVFDNRIGRGFTRALSILLSQPDLPPAEPMALFREIVFTFLTTVAPFALPIALGAAVATLAQTRLGLRKQALKPDFGRLSPAKGLKQMFGAESLMDTAKSLAKLAIVGAAVVQILLGELPRLMALPAAPLTVLPEILTRIVTRLLIAVLLAQTVIAGADYFWVWRRHQRTLRMSRTDIRDEQKETDGDPAIKARIRRIRMRRARQRMLAAVPAATVVVTNPTHYAVALSYDSEKSHVPTLVAKGVDSMAARIRETAAAHGVPIIANPPLARTLHQLPLGAAIPPELYKAVAELIAHVWRLSGRGR